MQLRVIGLSGRGSWGCWTLLVAAALCGCRHYQYARIVKPGEASMVGSHEAGGETFRPLVEESVGRLLTRHAEIPVELAGYPAPPAMGAAKRICFVGVENKSAEEIGDFKQQLYECVDSKILNSGVFQSISRRFVEAGLRDTRLRPDELMVPANMRAFAAVLEQQGQPFDYLLYATLTSGTTHSNQDYQRDYLLTLELVDIHSGQSFKDSAAISKGYHHSVISRWSARNWFQ